MSTRHGFKNAPSVTEFRRGMRVYCPRLAQWCSIECVDRNGRGYPEHGGDHIWLLSVPEMPQMKLDLSSIWEGREYEYKGHELGDSRATMVMANDDLVCFRQGGGHLVRRRDWFLANYSPVPLDQTAEVSQAKPEPEPWKPKAGKECEYQSLHGNWLRMNVRAVQGNHAWIATPGQPEYPGSVVHVFSLRPVPLEPPVKVGDVLQVTVDRRTYYGRVESICWPAFTLQWCVGDGNGHTKVLPFSPNTTITKLTAAPEAKP